MAEQKFGGDWTESKLSCLQQYLKAYRHIFTQNEKASYYRTWYVDVFAGTGSRLLPETPPESTLFGEIYDDDEASRYREGSAKMALGLAEPFDQYRFIEKSKGRVKELKDTIERKHSELRPRCDFRHGDANTVLKAWCQERDWKKERAVVFLDPFGMQVEWSTVKALAATKAIDLWYLALSHDCSNIRAASRNLGRSV